LYFSRSFDRDEPYSDLEDLNKLIWKEKKNSESIGRGEFKFGTL
jgi:hypothetical protein